MVIHSGWRYVILLGLLAGCNGADKKDSSAATDSANAPGPNRVTLPTEKTDTIDIDGKETVVKLVLIQPVSTIPFITYMPNDMISETRTSGLGEAHYFYANFDGKRDDQSYLLMHVLPVGTTKENAANVAKAFHEEGTQRGFAMKIDLRQHGNRFYYIGEHFPAKASGPMAARAAVVQQEWRWLDESTPSGPRL